VDAGSSLTYNDGGGRPLLISIAAVCMVKGRGRRRFVSLKMVCNEAVTKVCRMVRTSYCGPDVPCLYFYRLRNSHTFVSVMRGSVMVTRIDVGVDMDIVRGSAELSNLQTSPVELIMVTIKIVLESHHTLLLFYNHVYNI
jgi:hypothetical protein